MIDTAFVKRKLSLIQEDIDKLHEFSGLTIDEVAKDPVKHAAPERFLERIIGRAIDINQHMIAEADKTISPPRQYRDTFLRLGDLGVYPKEFAEAIAPSAGLRNVLVHEYNHIDQALLKQNIQETIEQFQEYMRFVLAYVDKMYEQDVRADNKN